MGIRSQIRNRSRFVSDSGDIDAKRFPLICLVSFLIHLLFFLGIFWFHNFDFQTPRPRVVTVDLVSFVPGPAGGAPPAPKAAEKKRTPAKKSDVNLNAKQDALTPSESAPVPILKPDISLKTKPKDVKKLMAAREKKAKPKPEKKKTPPKPRPDPEKELQKAREALAEKVEQQTQEQINEALSRMRAAIENKENKGQAAQGEGPGTGEGRKVSDPVLLYQMLLKSAIEQNWVFNDILARMDKHLQCRVLIKILKDGEVRDIIYTTRSGNAYLDDSAKKAIQRSNPLPPLPKGMASYDIELVFRPEGL